MKSATELLEAYLNNVRTPKVSASQFAEDGVLIADNGKIELLREALNTVAASKAFSKD